MKSTDLPVHGQLYMELVEKDVQNMFEQEVCLIFYSKHHLFFTVVVCLGQDDDERQAGVRES